MLQRVPPRSFQADLLILTIPPPWGNVLVFPVIDDGGVGIMGEGVLAKLVVTVIVLICFTVWLRSERSHSRSCYIDCPTNISASHK